MKEFTFTYLTKVYFGQNILEKALLAELGRYGRTVMLAYGGASLKKNGIYDRVKVLLVKEGKRAFSSFLQECGLPMKMGELKSKVEITPEVLRKVADTCNIIKCNPRELSRDEVYEILLECM